MLRRGGGVHRRAANDPDPTVAISHLEPDILGCKVRWASGSITKAVEVMGFQLSSFRS